MLINNLIWLNRDLIRLHYQFYDVFGQQILQQSHVILYAILFVCFMFAIRAFSSIKSRDDNDAHENHEKHRGVIGIIVLPYNIFVNARQFTV